MADKGRRPAVFFDRDGIVNIRPVDDYIRQVDEFHFVPDFMDFFSFVKFRDFLAILVTNQQCVGKGLVPMSRINEIHAFMQSEIEKLTGSKFDDIYICPDLKDSGSRCRKPEPGMILDAIEKWDIDPNKSWMIGDGISDAKAGRAAGVKTILIGNYTKEECPEADFIARDLVEAKRVVESFIC